MKIKFLFISLFIFSFKSFACDCDVPKKAIEFYESEYVFKGKVINKYYSTNLANYTIELEVIEHYKKNKDNPKHLEFTFRSEHNYDKNSCDFIIDKFDSLLIYTKRINDRLTFNLFCSNSKIITNKEITKKELLILRNGNDFDLSNYIFEENEHFTFSKPITIFEKYIKIFKKTDINSNDFVVIIADFDERGELMLANLKSSTKNIEYEVSDTIFNLNIIKNKKYREPKNKFESECLKISRKIIKWEPVKTKKDNKAVKFRKYLKFYFVNDKLIFEY